MKFKMKFTRTRSFTKKHPMLSVLLFSALLGIFIITVGFVPEYFSQNKEIVCSAGSLEESFQMIWEMLVVCLVWGIAVGEFFMLPIIVTVIEIRSLIKVIIGHEISSMFRYVDLGTIGIGVFCNIVYVDFMKNAMFGQDWYETLYNSQVHTPVFSESALTVWFILLIAVIGYLKVNFSSLKKMPPLVLVLGLSAMYLGTLESIVWMVQVFTGDTVADLYLLLLPICCVCITARTVVCKVREWNETLVIEKGTVPQTNEKTEVDEMIELIDESASEKPLKIKDKPKKMSNPFLFWCNRLLSNSKYWPIAAFLLMWPLLGIIIAILMLFGQEPDSIIKAWTETADWNLSQKVGPQNLYYDEHYLCTVAAGGHEEVVKPLRLGVRHGHPVIVNRQLCIANAFEQVLEEKTPRFHKVVRGFYDKYGFPVAKLIKSRSIADIIYILMKPLEWMFLIVLYLVDVNPENRIAVQYTGKNVKDFSKSRACL